MSKNNLSRTLGTAELVGEFDHDSPEWHAARAPVIGSSDVASILGVGYKSAFTLWHEKAGLIIPEPPDERLQRKFDYGHFMEPFVADQFHRRYPNLPASAKTGTWRHVARPWQGCNPDRILGEDSLIELKTFPMLSDWWDGPPNGYVVQLKWQLDVFGFTAGWLAGFANMSGELVAHEIALDPFEAEATRLRVKAFADSITDGVPPEIDGSEGTYQTLRRLNPSLERGAQADIPADIAEAYKLATANYREADSALNKWKGHLLAHMGTAQWAVYDGQRIASRVAKADSVPYLKEA